MLGNQAREVFRTAPRHKIYKTYLNISKQRTGREPGTRLGKPRISILCTRNVICSFGGGGGGVAAVTVSL
jgi:hypothetical protein